MNCEQFRELIPDLAREDASVSAYVADALTHAETCSGCDAQLREAELLSAALHSLALQHRFDAAPSRVESALVKTFRQQRGPAPRFLHAGGWLAVSTVGLAAAALGAILLTGYRPNSSPPQSGQPQNSPRETNRPAISPRAVWADYAVEGETAEETAAAYIPLAADFDPSWLEGGAIIRVTLTGQALENLGVPFSAGANSEFLADVVVNNDGTPQAIRVVDWQESNSP
jgi:hypothetical protein